MDLNDIKRGLRAEIKKRENEQYFTFQCNVRQMCKDVLSKLEEQESEIAELKHNLELATDECCSISERSTEKESRLRDEIAELKADYKEACDRLQTANLIKDEQIAATRHSKYKRCLAMARMCEERSARYDALQRKYDLDWGREIEFNYRWYKRWLKIAEQFKDKEAK